MTKKRYYWNVVRSTSQLSMGFDFPRIVRYKLFTS